MEIKQEDALQAFLLEVYETLGYSFPEKILKIKKKQYRILYKIESLATQRRSADATIHAGFVAFRIDVTQIGISQGCWNQNGQPSVSEQLGHSQSLY
jgi:hypothetical protein